MIEVLPGGSGLVISGIGQNSSSEEFTITSRTPGTRGPRMLRGMLATFGTFGGANQQMEANIGGVWHVIQGPAPFTVVIRWLNGGGNIAQSTFTGVYATRFRFRVTGGDGTTDLGGHLILADHLSKVSLIGSTSRDIDDI